MPLLLTLLPPEALPPLPLPPEPLLDAAAADELLLLAPLLVPFEVTPLSVIGDVAGGAYDAAPVTAPPHAAGLGFLAKNSFSLPALFAM